MSALTNTALKSTTAEGLALEILMRLQALERTSAKNPDNRNFISGTYNSDTGVFSGSFSLPCDQVLDATTGAVVVTAQEYLED